MQTVEKSGIGCRTTTYLCKLSPGDHLLVPYYYCIVLHCIVLHCLVLHCIALHCTVLYCIALYCIVLYCIVLYCIALHCIYQSIARFLQCTPIRSSSSARYPGRREQSCENEKRHLAHQLIKWIA